MTRLYTLGHSVLSLEAFLAVLDAAKIERLVDIRRFPGSRRHPHFGSESLAAALRAAGIAYVWREALGGRRSRRKDSPHTGWQVAAFAGYADYMQTPAFEVAARELVADAANARTTILCAEARPEQCHRRLVSDWCTAHGVQVVHLVGRGREREHTLTPFARMEAGQLIYDGGQPMLL